MPDANALGSQLLSEFKTLADFQAIATQNVAYLRDASRRVAVARTRYRQDYVLWNFAGQARQPRPVNSKLYIDDARLLAKSCKAVFSLLKSLADNRGPCPAIISSHHMTVEAGLTQRVFYTIQQSYGVACDVLLPHENQAKKHVGMKFESLVRALFAALGVAASPLAFRIPGGEDEADYRAEIDVVIGVEKSVGSTASRLDPRDVIVSVKGSSKDRMSKIFIDRMLLETIAKNPVKLIAVFHNDVQRKGAEEVSGTFVANLFLIYTRYLRPLNGVYFVDPPPHIDKASWKPHIKLLQDLAINDVWKLLKS